jgi:hypothetical protein
MWGYCFRIRNWLKEAYFYPMIRFIVTYKLEKRTLFDPKYITNKIMFFKPLFIIQFALDALPGHAIIVKWYIFSNVPTVYNSDCVCMALGRICMKNGYNVQ